MRKIRVKKNGAAKEKRGGRKKRRRTKRKRKAEVFLSYLQSLRR